MDEYQDINAAQDKIIQALSRDVVWSPAFEAARTNPNRLKAELSQHRANRFLVGDVKQSIYRFRLADPKIFREYAQSWRGKDGQMIPLDGKFSQPREPAWLREFRF